MLAARNAGQMGDVTQPLPGPTSTPVPPNSIPEVMSLWVRDRFPNSLCNTGWQDVWWNLTLFPEWIVGSQRCRFRSSREVRTSPQRPGQPIPLHLPSHGLKVAPIQALYPAQSLPEARLRPTATDPSVDSRQQDHRRRSTVCKGFGRSTVKTSGAFMYLPTMNEEEELIPSNPPQNQYGDPSSGDRMPCSESHVPGPLQDWGNNSEAPGPQDSQKG